MATFRGVIAIYTSVGVEVGVIRADGSFCLVQPTARLYADHTYKGRCLAQVDLLLSMWLTWLQRSSCGCYVISDRPKKNKRNQNRPQTKKSS